MTAVATMNAGEPKPEATGLASASAKRILVREIKTATSAWIKSERVFPAVTHWQDGYGAFTVSHGDKDAVIEYIKGQEEHHRIIEQSSSTK